MGVGWVRDPPHDGDGDLLNANLAINGVDRADQASGVAGSQLQEVLPLPFLVVGVAMEEHIGDLVLLAALKHCLDTVLDVQFLVLGTNAGRRRIQDDLYLFQEVLH